MGLREYLVKRTVYTIILILAVLTLNFLIFEAMPGNPLEAFLSKPGLTPEYVEELKEIYGLKKPWYEKYPIYLKNMLTFNFGSTTPQMGYQKVSDLIMRRLGNTILLIGISSIFAVIVGVIVGAYAAHERGKLIDSAVILISLATFALPTFWMGLIAQAIFGFWLRWFPVQGWATYPPIQDPLLHWIDRIQYLVLPGMILFLFTYGGFALLTRACVLETMTEDYVLTARAKGVKERTVLFKHILKNASLPIITNVALQFGFTLAGAIITETVFQYQGLGTLLYDAIMLKEVPVMQAMFYIIALCVIIANFLADIIYGFIDPRVKYG
jgi:peptide/nickel transport system permease protein